MNGPELLGSVGGSRPGLEIGAIADCILAACSSGRRVRRDKLLKQVACIIFLIRVKHNGSVVGL